MRQYLRQQHFNLFWQSEVCLSEMWTRLLILTGVNNKTVTITIVEALEGLYHGKSMFILSNRAKEKREKEKKCKNREFSFFVMATTG